MIVDALLLFGGALCGFIVGLKLDKVRRACNPKNWIKRGK